MNAVAAAHAATLRVPADYPTIQAAVNAAATGDEILLAPGTYTGIGNRDVEITGMDVVIASESGAAATIIDCQGSYEEPHRAFRFSDGVTMLTEVRGITMENGWRESGSGGAILCEESSIRLTDCVLRRNTSYSAGGAFHGRGGLIATGCVFDRNYGESGGGAIRMSTGTLVLDNCTLTRNGSSLAGAAVDGGAAMVMRACRFELNSSFADAGVVLAGSALDVSDCVFEQNSTDGWAGGITVGAVPLAGPASIRNTRFRANTGRLGGAIAVLGATVEITACDFTENWASRFRGNAMGGAIHFSGPGGSRVENCRFETNHAGGYSEADPPADGGAIACTAGADPVFDRCRFIGNEVSFPVTPLRGGAVYCEDESTPRFIRCVLAGNRIAGEGGFPERLGGAIAATGGAHAYLEGCTLYGNEAGTGGHAAWAGEGATITMESCILARNGAPGDEGDVVDCAGGDAMVTCCDVFGNTAGDWTGCLAGQEGDAGNFSADPSFCGELIADFRVRQDSPCLPGLHPEGSDCGLIGADDAGCGVTAVEHVTWGSLKTIVRR